MGMFNVTYSGAYIVENIRYGWILIEVHLVALCFKGFPC